MVKKKLFKTLVRILPNYRWRVMLLKRCGYTIGRDVYIGEDLIVSDELTDSGNLCIGDRVSIAPRVTLVTASSPNFSGLYKRIGIKKGKIVIKNDAWIGTNAVILPGVTIGEFSIVGAGAVVDKDVPSYVVVAGVPAKVIKKIGVEKDENSS